jgi:hypothetical protein
MQPVDRGEHRKHRK